MTHNFKIGVAYKTQSGKKVTYIGDGVHLNYPVFEYESHISYNGTHEVRHVPEPEIIGLWEDEPEEIDVADMWVPIDLHKDGSVCAGDCYATKEDALVLEGANLAVIRVREWSAIKRGERKLIKGEGL